jgi:hypothetical protein
MVIVAHPEAPMSAKIAAAGKKNFIARSFSIYHSGLIDRIGRSCAPELLFDPFVFSVFLPVPLAQHRVRFLHREFAQLGGERVIVTAAANVYWRPVAGARICRCIGTRGRR